MAPIRLDPIARVLLAALVAVGLGCGERRGERLLLLITADTLRADHLGAYGGPAGLTPHIDALMAESQVFEAAYATCSYTLPSLSSLMTGRYPEEVGVLANDSQVGRSHATLASVLELYGWRTGAVVSNYVLRRAAGLDRGFSLYDDHFPQRESNRDVPERIAAPTTDAALAALDRLSADSRDGAGVFLWVHYQDPHGPYLPPGERRQRWLAQARSSPRGRVELETAQRRGIGSIPAYQYVEDQHQAAFYMAGYAGEIAYLDEEVGRLLAGVAERGRLERAVVVFGADHGEGLGEGNYWFSHGEYLSEPLVRVPLSIRLPGARGGRRADRASLIDVFPTLLALFEIPVPDGQPGRDLLAPGAAAQQAPIYLASLRGGALPRHAIIEGDHKLVVTAAGGGLHESLFRIDDEERDLRSEQPQIAKALRARMAEIRGRLRRPPVENRQALSADERRRLRQLGYAVD